MMRRWVLTCGVLLLGFGIALWSWLLDDVNPWWGNMLANISVVTILLVPGELVLAQLRERVAKAESASVRAAESAEAAVTVANDARDESRALAASLEELQQSLVDQQEHELEAEVSRIRDIETNFSRSTLYAVLRDATDQRIITSVGVRAPVWETEIHYRFVLDAAEPGGITVQLENDDASIISSVDWTADESPQAFLERLVLAVRASGHDLGTGLNVPTESIRQLTDMLVDVTRLRAQVLAGHRGTLSQIIERRGGWYFTEKGMVPEKMLSYFIRRKHLNEQDWELHLLRRGWGEGPAAIQFARRLYGHDLG